MSTENRTVMLHELIPVRRTKAEQLKVIHTETLSLFGKPAALKAHRKQYSHMADMEDVARDALEASKSVGSTMTTTVEERLRYDIEFLNNYMSLQLQIAETNNRAMADLRLDDGTLLADNLPALFLQSLDDWLGEFRQRLLQAPTVPNTVELVPDNFEGKNCWKTRTPVVTLAEEKVPTALVLAPPTDKHPAQVKEIVLTKVIGKYEEQTWYGMMTSAEKADRLGRIDRLIAAVKAAQARANSQPVTPARKLDSLMRFVMDGK